MVEGVELTVYSASGVYLGGVRTFMQLQRMIEQSPERVFDAGDKKAWVDGDGFHILSSTSLSSPKISARCGTDI